jgi:dienelactone hydrolase
MKQLVPLMNDKKYEEAIAVTRKMIALNAGLPECYYNLACFQTQLGQTEDAFANLKKAVDLGYADAEQIKTDSDLESLRKDPRFDLLVATAADNFKKADPNAAFPYDQGTEIAGLKKVESVVKNGLRFRLWMNPKATKEKPDRLIVWLHPSGSLANNTVEKMAPLFSRHGFALVVFTQKNPKDWSVPDLKRMLVSLSAISRIDGLDLRPPLPPVLLGYSAGGQAALLLWSNNTVQFGGLILDAAYPLDLATMTPDKKHVNALMPPPGEVAKATPFFVLVGEEDSGATLWRKVQDAWLNAGVPLVIHYVPKAKHQWLFNATETVELEKWLTDVAAGKKPAGLPAALERPADPGKPPSAPPLN